MLHGTCGELPGGPGWQGHPHTLYKRGAALVCPSAGQGCAEEDEEDDARCWGHGAFPGQQERGQSAVRGSAHQLPSLIGLGARLRSRRRDTWEERGGQSCPCFKARVCFPGAGGTEPRKAVWGPLQVPVGSGWLWEPGQAAPSPRKPVWRHCPYPLRAAGASRGAAGLTPVAVGDPKGMEPSPLGPNCLQKPWVPHLHITLSASKDILLGRSGVAPHRETGTRQPLLISWGSGHWRIQNWAPRGAGLAAWVPC